MDSGNELLFGSSCGHLFVFEAGFQKNNLPGKRIKTRGHSANANWF